MGYFPNGTTGMMYEEKYCNRCKHNLSIGCPILELHAIYNYDECNNDNSILHKAIPLDEKGDNKECIFFNKRVTP